MLITGNQRLIRHVNRMAILREIRKRPGISRTELAELTGLTRAAIGRLVEGLAKDGWLAEEARQASSALGRRPIPLVFDESRMVLLGAHLNGEYLRLVASTLSGVLLESSTELTEGCDGKEILSLLVERIAGLHQRVAAMGRTVCGLGVAVPGPVDPANGVLRFSESTGWRELPVKASIESGLAVEGIRDIPVIVDRAVNCIALQHAERNHAELSDTLLYVHVGQSVAVSAMVNGELLRGNQGMAGYVAHQSLVLNGPVCVCGHAGCVHVMLTFEALCVAFDLPCNMGAQAVQRAIRDAVAHNDWRGQETMAAFAGNLGRFVFNLSRIHDPARVFLGGAVFELGVDLIEGIRSQLAALCDESDLPEVQAMRVDEYTVAQGAAVAALRDLLKLGSGMPQRA